MLDIFGFFALGIIFIFCSTRRKLVAGLAALLAIGSPIDETLRLTKEQKQKTTKIVLIVLGSICLATSVILLLVGLFE